MNPKVMLFLFFGVGIVGVVMFIHTTKPALLKPAPPKKVYLHVFVAKHNLEIGHLIKADDLTEKTYLSGKQPVGSVVTTQQDVFGSVVSFPIAAGSVIFNSDLISQDEPSFLAYALPPGKGAMSIVLTSQNAVDSFVQAGDRVDVFVRVTSSGNARSAQVALRNVLVLSINHHLEKVKFIRASSTFWRQLSERGVSQTTIKQRQEELQSAADSGKSTPAAPSLIAPDKPLVITLEVTPEEAAMLMQATNLGILSLMLRSAQDNSDIGTSSVVSGPMVIYNGP